MESRGRPKMMFNKFVLDKQTNGWSVEASGRNTWKRYVFNKLEDMLDFLRDHS